MEADRTKDVSLRSSKMKEGKLTFQALVANRGDVKLTVLTTCYRSYDARQYVPITVAPVKADLPINNLIQIIVR